MESPVHLHLLQFFQPTMFLATPGPQAPPNCILNHIFLKSNYLLTTMAQISQGVKHHWREGGETHLASHIHYFLRKPGWNRLAHPSTVFAPENRVWQGSIFTLPVRSGGRGARGELQQLLQIHTKAQEAQRNLLRTCPHTLDIPFIFAVTKKSR